MGFSLEDDCRAASQALLLSQNYIQHSISFHEACEIVRKSEVCILGGSSSLEKALLQGRLNDCHRLLTVDGATRLALEYGFRPDIIVGDADGGLAPIIKSSQQGSLVILHVHGDNMWIASYLVPLLKNYMVSVQCNPLPPYTWIIPGFTDGERALGFAILCGASRVRVYGMNVDEPVGWWSKPWLKSSVRPWPQKKIKLEIARIVFEAFKRVALSQGISLVWL
jgi:uncharacterized Rossmann fold enzyme